MKIRMGAATVSAIALVMASHAAVAARATSSQPGRLEESATSITPGSQKSATAKNRRTTMSSDPELMTPLKLSEQAPATYDAKFVTTAGDFTIHVVREWAPLGADRFYNLVKYHFYTDASVFRVLPGFVAQFGISADPRISWVWQNANIKDDPVKQSNIKGTVTFATGGPNTRTTQVFINLANNATLDSRGFAPFGQVTEGMSVVEKLYSGYGEGASNQQGAIQAQGKAFLDKNFPKLDSIKSAAIAASGPAHHAPATHAPAKPH
jgi:peptidyl-prolyl cis-trans isomerase A (cyclophilin A)